MASRSSSPDPATSAAAGVDAGASLIKLALLDERGEVALHCLDRDEAPLLAERLQRQSAKRVVLTGCGARQLAAGIPGAHCIEEFDAWARGARLRVEGDAPFLLVSLGTGTSASLVRPGEARRVGGTALGGGTLLGLSAALLGTRNWEEVTALAARGDRTQVDLTIGDLYGDDFELPAFFTAASLGKLMPGTHADPADLAQGIVCMIGENVGRTCALIAKEQGAERVLFGGGTLRGNELLANLLCGMCRVAGVEASLLEDGEYMGALGALELARSAGAAGGRGS